MKPAIFDFENPGQSGLSIYELGDFEGYSHFEICILWKAHESQNILRKHGKLSFQILRKPGVLPE